MSQPQPLHTESDALLHAKKHEPLKPQVIVIAGCTCVSGLLLGYDVGITNGSLGPVAATFSLNEEGKELYVGMLNAWALVGCVVGGSLADSLGRRLVTILGSTVFLVAGVIMTFTPSYSILLSGRALAGLSVGMTLVTAPLYASEIAPAQIRGMLSTNVEVSQNLGILLGFVASWALSGFSDGLSWRLMISISLLPPIICLIATFFFIPESPRWLALRGRIAEAEAVVNEIYGPQEAAAATVALRKMATDGECNEADWSSMFRCNHLRYVTMIAGGVAFFSQATGVETVMYYSAEILQVSGMNEDSMLAATSGMGLTKLIAIMFSGNVVDSFGRRPLLLVSSLGMCASMTTLGVSFWYGLSIYIRIFAIYAFVVAFSLGYGPIVYTLCAEVFPTPYRAKGVSFSMSIGRIVSAMVSITFLTLVRLLGISGAFLFFAGMGLISAAFVVLFVPETKGIALEGSPATSRKPTSCGDRR